MVIIEETNRHDKGGNSGGAPRPGRRGDRRLVLVGLPPWKPNAPPLGVAYVAEYMRAQGWSVRVVDGNRFIHDALSGTLAAERLWRKGEIKAWRGIRYQREVLPALAAFLDELAERIAEDDPPLIGFSCVTRASLSIADDLLARVRRLLPEAICVAGGAGVFGRNAHAGLRRDGFDFLVEGEGEHTLAELSEGIVGGAAAEALARVPGVIPWRGAGADPYARFSPRTPEFDLRRFGFPTFDGFDLERYDEIHLLMSRGCIRRCRFCDEDVRAYGAHRRMVPPDVVVASLKHLSRYRKPFNFCDLVINGDIEHLEKIAEGIIEAGLDVAWMGMATIRKEMTPPLLTKLRQAGLNGLAYGLESLSDPVLKGMGKGYRRDTALTVLRHSHDAGLGTVVALVMGFPTETPECFAETLACAEANSDWVHFISMTACMAIEGSDLAQRPERYGISFGAGQPGEYRSELDAEQYELDWIGPDGNTFDERIDRVRRLSAMFVERGQTFEPNPFFDGDDVALVFVPETSAASGRRERFERWSGSLCDALRARGGRARIFDLEARLADADAVSTDDLVAWRRDAQPRPGARAAATEAFLDRLLEPIFDVHAPFAVLWFEHWDDPLAQAVALRLHEMEAGQLLLPAEDRWPPDGEVPFPFGAVLVGDVPGALLALLHGYRSGRSLRALPMEGVRWSPGAADFVPWWLPDLELLHWEQGSAPASEQGSERSVVAPGRGRWTLLAHRSIGPSRFELTVRAKTDGSGYGTMAIRSWQLPRGRVAAGSRIVLECSLPSATRPLFLHLRWFGPSEDGGEHERLLPQDAMVVEAGGADVESPLAAGSDLSVRVEPALGPPPELEARRRPAARWDYVYPVRIAAGVAPQRDARALSQAEATPQVVYVHPNGQALPLTIPVGVLANFNALRVPKLGAYQFEMDDEVIRSARVICVSLHWYMPMAALVPYCGYIKSVNPNVKIVAGGLTANIFAELLLRAAPIDYVLVGDTEPSFCALIEGILAGQSAESLAAIPNVWSRLGAPQQRTAHDDGSYGQLNWLDHDWFPSFALWTRWVHGQFDQEAQVSDHCFPTVPLMRGCRYPCPQCIGDYQRHLAQRPPVHLERERLIADLDKIQDAGYRFAVFTNGLDILGLLRDGPFDKVYDLDVQMPICFLPQLQELRNLCDSFRSCRLRITYPEDDLLFNRVQQHRDANFLDRFYETLAAVDRPNLGVDLSRVLESGEDRRVLEERLEREPIPFVRMRRVYDWARPVPAVELVDGGDSAPAFAQFLHWSHEFQNYLVASSLFPKGKNVFVAWQPLRAFDAGGVEADGDWARVQEAFRSRYLERAVPGVAAVELQCHALGAAIGEAAALVGWCSSERAGNNLSTAAAQFDWHLPHFEFRYSTLGSARDLVLVPRLRLDPAQDEWIAGRLGIRLSLPAVTDAAETLDVAVGRDRLLVRLLNKQRQPLWVHEMRLENKVAHLEKMITPQSLVNDLVSTLDGVAHGSGALAGWSVAHQATARCSFILDPPAGTSAGKYMVVPRSTNSPGVATRLFAIQMPPLADPEVARALVEAIQGWEEGLVATPQAAVSVENTDAAPVGSNDEGRLGDFLLMFLGQSSPPFHIDSEWRVREASIGRWGSLYYVTLSCEGAHGAVSIRLEPKYRGARFFARTHFLTLSYVGEPPAIAELEGLMTSLRAQIATAERQLTPERVRNLLVAAGETVS